MLGLTGDALAVFGIWMSGALTSAVGAVAVRGRTRAALWVLATIFGLLAVGALITARRVDWGALLPIAYALMPPLTVGAVAAMLRGANEAPTEIRQPMGAPNITLETAYDVIDDSAWGQQFGRLTSEIILQELRDKLHMRRITAFGRKTAGAPLEPIPARAWKRLRLDKTKNAAVDHRGRAAFTDIQFNGDHVRARWGL